MTQRSQWWPQKEEVVAEQGMVVAKHPLAAEAGLDILKRGDQVRREGCRCRRLIQRRLRILILIPIEEKLKIIRNTSAT